VAIGRGFRDQIERDHAAGAGPVLDDDPVARDCRDDLETKTGLGAVLLMAAALTHAQSFNLVTRETLLRGNLSRVKVVPLAKRV